MEGYRIGIVGCAGRMGRMLSRTVHETEGCLLAGGSDRAESGAVGSDLGLLAGIGPLDLPVSDDSVALIAASDAIIDFTTPAATAAHADLAAQARAVHVIGTTGLDEAAQARIDLAARHTAVVQAANMSLGVNLLLGLVEQVARALDPDYDIEILDLHHRHKVDAPSGTALALGRAAAQGRGVALDEAAVRSRDGIVGPRKPGDIGFGVLRGGDVAGDHSVIFAGPGERVILEHRATSREVFAKGAVKAALWARDKTPGLYSMRDVLGI